MTGELILNATALDEHKGLLKQNKWASIPHILSAQSADLLHHALTNEVSWKLRMAKGEDKAEYTEQQLSFLSPQQQQMLAQKYHDADFIYMHYRLDKDFVDITNKPSILHDVSDLFNSEYFLTAMKNLTGDEKINYADCRATCFRTGHYLKKHDDFRLGSKRHYAYVLNMTKNWEPDWGGCLHILDHSNNISKTLPPQFNVLNIFRVPVPHFVSSVAPYAKAGRLGITGWFYAQ